MAQTGRSCAFPGSVACVQRQAAGLRTPARWATITIKGQHTGPKDGNETSTWHVRGPLLIAYRTQQLGHHAVSVSCPISDIGGEDYAALNIDSTVPARCAVESTN